MGSFLGMSKLRRIMNLTHWVSMPNTR
jgi:hypothetical protein